MPLCLPEQLCASGEYGGGGGNFAAHVVETRRMRSALEFGGAVAGGGEHRRHGIDMPRFARVARAKQRNLGLRVTKPIHASARDKRHRLERLQRAARHREKFRIARGVQQVAVAIDDGDRSVVNRVDGVAAGCDRELGMRRVQRGSPRAGRRRKG